MDFPVEEAALEAEAAVARGEFHCIKIDSIRLFLYALHEKSIPSVVYNNSMHNSR